MPKCVVRSLSPTEILVTGSAELPKWREAHTIVVPGAEYTKQYKKHVWDGKHAPGRWCRRCDHTTWEMRCSRGLVGRLAASFELQMVNGGPSTPRGLEWLESRRSTIDQLRDYQLEALLAILANQWGRVALATNAGKGAVIALLADFATFTNTRALILCDEIAVFDALLDEINKWTSITPGCIRGGTKNPPDDPVVLAMVPTLAKRIKHLAWREWLTGFGMLLLDEADKATAAGWRKILTNSRGSHWRVGFSGTFPNPQENPYADLLLDELMGVVLSRARNLDLVERKISAKPQVELHGYDVTLSALARPKKWWELPAPSRRRFVYEQAFVYNHQRHEFIRQLIRPDVATAIVVNRITHGEQLALTIPGATFIDGSTSPQQRRKALESFAAGDIKVLIVSKILDRGTNRLGHTSDLLFVSGEGSTRQTLQRIGRGLRRTGGKEFLRLVDIMDRADVDPNSKDKWAKMAAKFIHTAGRKRLQLYHDEGFEVEIIR